MEVVVGDLLTIEGKKYITLGVLEYDNNNYAFVNLLVDEEETTEEFYVFKLVDDGVRLVIEEDLLNVLLPKFQELLKNDIRDLMND